MIPMQSIGAAWWACKAPLAVGGDLRPWTPLALLTIGRTAILLFLVFFHRPEWVGVGLPLVEWLGGPEASHYPSHLLMLPALFHELDRWVLVLVGGPVAIATLRPLAASVTGTTRAAFPVSARRPFDAVLVAAVLVGVDLAVTSAFGVLPEAFQDRGGKLGLALLLVRIGATALILAPLLYALTCIVLLDLPARRALARSIDIARRHPATTLTLMALFAGAMVPFEVFGGPVGSGKIAGTPEAMVVLLALRLVYEMLLAYVALAATTRVVLWTTGEDL